MLARLAKSLRDEVAYSESMLTGHALAHGLLSQGESLVLEMNSLQHHLRQCNVPRFWLLLAEQSPIKASLGFFWRYALMTDQDIHFYPDEVYRQVDPRWDLETLLAQRAVFDLDEISGFLDLDVEGLQQVVHELSERGSNCWHLMGLRYFGGTWMVRMMLFSRYYKTHLVSP